MTTPHASESRIWPAGVVVPLAPLLFCAACAAPEPKPDGAEAERSPQAAERSAENYGTDPMGVAHRWADDPPDQGPNGGANRIRSWDDASVLRVVRESVHRYRALLANSDDENAEALLLVIERDGDRWAVTAIETADARFLWPRM